MEPEGSLPHSQMQATCPILSHIDPVRAHTSHFLKFSQYTSHLCLDLLGCLFPSSFPTKTLQTPLLSPPPIPPYVLYAPPITQNIDWGVQSIKLLIMYFLHSPVTLSLLGPSILHSTLFSIHTAYIPPSVWATKFHTLQQHTKLYFCIS